MSVPFGSRAKLRELKVLDAFENRDSRTISELVPIVKVIDDKYEIEPVAAITAAVIDLKRYGLLEEDRDQDWWKQKKYKLTEKGRESLKEQGETCKQ